MPRKAKTQTRKFLRKQGTIFRKAVVKTLEELGAELVDAADDFHGGRYKLHSPFGPVSITVYSADLKHEDSFLELGWLACCLEFFRWPEVPGGTWFGWKHHKQNRDYFGDWLGEHAATDAEQHLRKFLKVGPAGAPTAEQLAEYVREAQERVAQWAAWRNEESRKRQELQPSGADDVQNPTR